MLPTPNHHRSTDGRGEEGRRKKKVAMVEASAELHSSYWLPFVYSGFTSAGYFE